MYKIFADDTLIYDSTIEDYKIGKGSISLEVNKSGSFTFSLYPDHFYYDQFVKLKTVITVYKSGKIVFRGRILNDVTDYNNIKVITCEGELGFLQDSIIRPFAFTGSPAALFTQFIEEHNSQVDEFKRFKIGTVTVIDSNDYVNRSSTDYGKTSKVLNDITVGSSLGGYLYITHGDDGTDIIPTIHYLADFERVSTQTIEFGVNLKNYTKTVKAEDVITALIPLGTEVSNADVKTRLTIEEVNDGKDYIYSPEGVALYGWIFDSATWEDVTLPSNLKRKAEEYLEAVVNQNLTIELNAIDMHLLDHSIESFKVCDYIRVISEPHYVDRVMLCNKQTLDLLRPENDSVVLGYSTPTFTGSSTALASSISVLGKDISSIKQTASSITLTVEKQNESISTIEQTADSIAARVENVLGNSSELIQTVDNLSSRVQNAEGDISALEQSASSLTSSIQNQNGQISSIQQTASGLSSTVNDLSGKYSSLKQTVDGFDIEGDINSILSDGVAQMNFVYGSTKVGTVAQYGSGTMIVQGAGELLLTAKDGNLQLNGTDGVEINSDVDIDLTADEDIYLDASYGRLYLYGGDTTVKVTDDGMSVDNDLWVDGTKIASSDKNVKNTVTYDLDTFSDFYRTLKPCRFKYNNGKSGRFHTGFIAQEIEQAITDAGFSDTDLAMVVQENHGEDDAGKYGVRYEEIIALNTAFIQKLLSRVETLEAELAKFKGEEV